MSAVALLISSEELTKHFKVRALVNRTPTQAVEVVGVRRQAVPGLVRALGTANGLCCKMHAAKLLRTVWPC